MGYRSISGPFHLVNTCRDHADFRIGVHPEVFYFCRAFRSEPGCFAHCDETAFFQVFVPFIHSTFESYIVDCSFGPDQIEFLILKREIIHWSGDSFYSVGAIGFHRILIEYFDKIGKEVYARNLSFHVVSQKQCLTACAAADIGNLCIIGQFVDETYSFACGFRTSGTLTFQQLEVVTYEREIEIMYRCIIVTHCF